MRGCKVCFYRCLLALFKERASQRQKHFFDFAIERGFCNDGNARRSFVRRKREGRSLSQKTPRRSVGGIYPLAHASALSTHKRTCTRST